MKETVLVEIIKYIVPTVLSFLVGWLSTRLKKAKAAATEQAETKKAIMESLKWLMRRCLIEDCEVYIEQGYITVEELAELEKVWHTYHEILGGNGKGQLIFEEVKKLPIKVKEEH